MLFRLDQLGKIFGTNRDVYYTLGQYLGYTDIFLSVIESQKGPLAWISCSTCTKTDDITSFISTLEHYFYDYGHLDRFRYFISFNGFSTLLNSSYCRLYKIMDKVLSDLRKTIKDFNKDNQGKGYKVKYHIWNKSNSNVLCQVLVTQGK